MSEPNPYESPKTPRPEQLVKRGLGLGAILLLTPVAVGIAFGMSCGATMTFLSIFEQSDNYPLLIFGGWGIFLLPPLITLAAMIWWAIRTHRECMKRVLQKPWKKNLPEFDDPRQDSA